MTLLKVPVLLLALTLISIFVPYIPMVDALVIIMARVTVRVVAYRALLADSALQGD